MQPTINFIANGMTRISNALSSTHGRRATIGLGSLVSIAGTVLTVRSGVRAALQCVQEPWNYKSLAYAFDISKFLEAVELYHPTCKTQIIYSAVGASLTIGAIVITAKVAKKHFAKPATPPKPGLPFPNSNTDGNRNLTLLAPIELDQKELAKEQEKNGCIVS